MLFAGWEVRIVKNRDQGLELEKNSHKRYCDRGQIGKSGPR